MSWRALLGMLELPITPSIAPIRIDRISNADVITFSLPLEGRWISGCVSKEDRSFVDSLRADAKVLD